MSSLSYTVISFILQVLLPTIIVYAALGPISNWKKVFGHSSPKLPTILTVVLAFMASAVGFLAAFGPVPGISPASLLLSEEIFVVWFLAGLVSVLAANIRRFRRELFKRESGFFHLILPILVFSAAPISFGLATLYTLGLLDVQITSFLVVSGVLGIVIGFAVQDTVSNIFAGFGLKADDSFREGDLIAMPDGKIYQVERISERSTRLYNFVEHTSVFVPNNTLANATVTNVTRPTSDLRVAIPVGFQYGGPLEDISANLKSIAAKHPNVLLSDCAAKVKILNENAYGRDQATINGYINRVNREREVDKTIQDFESAITRVILRELGSKSPDLRSIWDTLDGYCKSVRKVTETWIACKDPESDKREWAEERARWEEIMNELDDKMNDMKDDVSDRLKKGRIEYAKREAKSSTNKPSEEEAESLNMCRESDARKVTRPFFQWLYSRYKAPTERWKDPDVTFSDFGSSGVNLILHFYIDNVRLERFQRKERVLAEIGNRIHKEYHDLIPFQQVDIHVKNGSQNEQLSPKSAPESPTDKNPYPLVAPQM